MPTPANPRRVFCLRCGIDITDTDGTTFTVCSDCWDAEHGRHATPANPSPSDEEVEQWLWMLDASKGLLDGIEQVHKDMPAALAIVLRSLLTSRRTHAAELRRVAEAVRHACAVSAGPLIPSVDIDAILTEARNAQR